MALPSFDLSQESSEVESFETTTTSVIKNTHSLIACMYDFGCPNRLKQQRGFRPPPVIYHDCALAGKEYTLQ